MSELEIEVTYGDPIEAFQSAELSADHREIYELLGRVITLWNRLEGDLTRLVHWLQPAFFDQLPKKYKIRRMGLNAKLNFIDYLINEYHEFSIFQEEFCKYKEEIDSVKDKRHKIVHWSLLTYRKENDCLSMVLFNPEKMTLPLDEFVVTQATLMELAERFGRLSLSFGFFATSFDTRLKARLKSG